jgi:hypothetical protein
VLEKVVLRRILDLQERERENNRRTEKVVLKRIFGSRRKAVTGERRRWC